MNKNQHKTMTTNDIYFVFAYIYIIYTYNVSKKYQLYIYMRTFYNANKFVQIQIRKGVKKSNTKIYKKNIYIYMYIVYSDK